MHYNSDRRSKFSTCVPPGAFFRHAPRDGKRVALTFDDTPGPDTGAIGLTLAKRHVPATFFVIGDEVDAASGGVLRRLLVDGMELGNHSFGHVNLIAGGAQATKQIDVANRAIDAQTGFTPCLFRAPYGKVGPPLVRTAVAAGMTTIGWDVDPSDWTHPGADKIIARVLAAVRPGSIVVLHDNVESEGQTVEALPAIVSGLDRMGYRMVTVSELLGGRLKRR